MTTILRDLRYAARQLANAPLFTGLAILSFGLGIGANTTVYTWARALLFDPFPVASEGSRLVSMNITDKNQGFISTSYPDYRDIKARTKTLDGVIALRSTSVGLGGGDKPVRVYAEVVSGEYFDVLGVPLALGRGFLPSEDATPLSSAVLVIGYELWQREFGGDPAIIGRSVLVNAKSFTVVGVAADGFFGTRQGLASEVWAPLMMQEWLEPGGAGRLEQRGNSWLSTMGRLAPGFTVQAAQAELATIGLALAREYPENANPGKGISLAPLWRAPRSPAETMGPVLAVLGGVALLVLAIAAMNVASLLLARAMGRRREISVRVALGASRGRIVRQLLAESFLLSLAGGLTGVFVAYAGGASLLERLIPPTNFPVRLGAVVDGQVLAVAVVLGVGTGLLFGLVPALQTSRPDASTVMREEAGSVAGSSGRSRWFRRLVVGQLAGSTVMLVIAGLFVRSLDRASSFDVGFDPKGVLISSVDLFTSGYNAERGQMFFEQLKDEASHLPGVTAVALARRVPLGFGGSSSTTFEVEGFEAAKDANPWGFFNVISPGYFEVMRMPLSKGRGFEAADSATAPAVAVINNTMAQRFWPGKDAVGGRFRLGPDWVTVVGVAEDAVYRDLSEQKAPWFFLPLAQRYRADMTLMLRSSSDPVALAEPVRQLTARLDPNLALFGTRTLEDHIKAAAVRQSVGGQMLSVLGILGLLLAAVGLFGTLAFGVAQRTREMGIRLALGGFRDNLVLMVVEEGLMLSAKGVAVGLVLAVGAGRLMKGLLLGVSPWDPATLAPVVLILGLASLLACLVPAWRAASTDPMKALRAE